MKGKKIETLLGYLQPAELQILAHRHQARGDKRSQWLCRWISAGQGGPPPEPEAWWRAQVAEKAKGQSATETDKIIRRWITFLSRELEKGMLWQLLDEKPKAIPGLMIQLLPAASLEGILGHYLVPAFNHASEGADYALMLRALQLQLVKQANADERNRREEGLELLVAHNSYADQYFHRMKIDTLNMLSALYLDNPDVRARAGQLFPADEEIELRCRQSAGTVMEAEYRLIQARFAHQNPAKFKTALRKSEQILESVDGHSRDIIRRRILYLKLIVGYTRGLKTPALLTFAAGIHETNEAHGFPDSGGFFHFVLLLMLSQKYEQASELLNARADFYFQSGNIQMKEFLNSFGAVLSPGHFNGIPSRLQALNYSRNTYLSIWSSLIFAAHHLRKGNSEFAFTLLGRMKQRVKKLPPHFFTRTESLKLMTWMETYLLEGRKAPAAPWGMTPLHDAIIQIALG